MIIAEHLAQCPDSEARADVFQRADEGRREFEARAFVRLTRTLHQDAPRKIFLHCDSRNDPESLAERTTLCRAALALLFRSGGGNVVLVTHARSPSRTQLVALAESLNSMLDGSDLRISVEVCGHALKAPEDEPAKSQRVA